MKLIIQIPCFNEESQLPLTLSHHPRQVARSDVGAVALIGAMLLDVGATATGREVDSQRGQPPPAGALDREALEV